MRILTNFERFPERWSTSGGLTGTARQASPSEFHLFAAEADLLLVNGDANFIYMWAWRSLLWGRVRKPLVAVDVVLRAPQTLAGHVRCLFKRLLFSRVDHFIHYFRESPGYERYYGIGRSRSSFVPFKPNINYVYESQHCPEGDYVLCFGRSQRDYDTFLAAMERLPYPAALPRPKFAALAEHNSRFTWPLDRLPANVRLLEDDGSRESMVHILEGARLVVLPVRPGSLLGGVSVYLNAMSMRKCVVATEGPSISDVLTGGEALLAPQGDPDALAKMIRRAWEDNDLRLRTAALGHTYACSLGSEQDFYQRILEAIAAWWRR